jgi:nucleotide-binding universal stress UspA family protein
MSRHITLVGVDYSNHSKIALATAASIARTANGELHVAHVVAPSYGAYPSDAPLTAVAYPETTDNYFVEWFAKVGEDTKQRLPAFCAALVEDMPCETSAHIRIGHAARELIALAKELEADLLVVGTQGRTGLERVLMGSVAEHVVRAAPCPVLVARPRESPEVVDIESACPECVELRTSTTSHQTWCVRHSAHHPRAHTYREYPQSFGLGALTFRL